MYILLSFLYKDTQRRLSLVYDTETSVLIPVTAEVQDIETKNRTTFRLIERGFLSEYCDTWVGMNTNNKQLKRFHYLSLQENDTRYWSCYKTRLAADASSIDLIILSSMSMYRHYSSLDSRGWYCIVLMMLLFFSEMAN